MLCDKFHLSEFVQIIYCRSAQISNFQLFLLSSTANSRSAEGRGVDEEIAQRQSFTISRVSIRPTNESWSHSTFLFFAFLFIAKMMLKESVDIFYWSET